MGSVFSPYYYAARNSGEKPNPLDFAAFNVALYGRNAERWTFTEHTARAVRRGPTELSIGESCITADRDGEVRLTLNETSPFLKRQVAGTVDIRFAHRYDTIFTLDGGERHRWHPIVPRAAIEVRLSSPELRFTGTAYHDMNWGERPLEADFHEWSWSRHALSDRTAVYYDGVQANREPFSIGAAFDDNGTMSELVTKPETVRLPDTRIWRCPRPIRSDGTPRVMKTFENSPFYSRSLVETTLFGEPSPAVHETLRLHRFTEQTMQWMLRFRLRREP